MASAGFGAAFRQLRGLFGGGSVVGLGDGPLLARYSGSKDEAAFEALVGRHGPMVLATCRAVLKNEHDVEDAFQATFLVLARKAHSVRGGDSLAGWLHRVAYRAAVQAGVEAKKRRLKEAEASARMITHRDGPDAELVALLHEEIDRLPEGQRLPVVLCDLEGLTSEQAARHLRWTEPTVRHRLADGRRRLRARLTRRGVTAPAIGPLPVASAAVPPSLARMALSAATGGPVPAGPALLAHTLLRGMLMTQIKIASAAILAALALASAGWIAIGAGRPEDPGPAMTPKARAKAAAVAREEPAAKKPAEMVEIKGRVVAPDGQPVAGAAVRGAYLDRNARPFPAATSGPDGRFTIRLPKPKGDPMSRYPWLLASAPEYGLGWSEGVLRPDRPDEQVVKVVEEGPPLEGRIIDLEGRPVAGATIRASRIWYDAQGDLAGWVAKARRGAEGNIWTGLENLPLDEGLAIETRSDADGRFRLAGIGRDRVAGLLVSRSGVATTEVKVLSRDGPEIRASDSSIPRLAPFIVHAPRFQLALMPSRRVEGIARDRDSGRPIAGLEVKGDAFDEHSLVWVEGVSSKTDAEGRYRLEGLPAAAAYRLFITPDEGLPYNNATLKAPAGSPVTERATFDFTLKRGIIVRARVTDKVTGRPVQGQASYHVFDDNPNLKDYPGLNEGYPQYADAGEAGRFEFVAVPGRGLLTFRDSWYRYRPATGFEKIEGYVPGSKAFRTQPNAVFARGFNVIAEVVADPEVESMTMDLQADPGKSVAIEVVGPEGRPLGGTKVRGMSESYATMASPQESTGFEINGLDPGKPRRVVVAHERLKLIGSALLTGDEAGPITLKLQPWGTVAGRIVDDEGQPRKGMFLGNPDDPDEKGPGTHGTLPDSDWNNGIRVGDDGRFSVEGLVPGLKYGATARKGIEAFDELFMDLAVAPGEVKDLGDIKTKPRPK